MVYEGNSQWNGGWLGVPLWLRKPADWWRHQMSVQTPVGSLVHGLDEGFYSPDLTTKYLAFYHTSSCGIRHQAVSSSLSRHGHFEGCWNHGGFEDDQPVEKKNRGWEGVPYASQFTSNRWCFEIKQCEAACEKRWKPNSFFVSTIDRLLQIRVNPMYFILLVYLHDWVILRANVWTKEGFLLTVLICGFVWNWLVVWTPLKNISQLGWLFPIYGKIKNGNQTTNQIFRHLHLWTHVFTKPPATLSASRDLQLAQFQAATNSASYGECRQVKFRCSKTLMMSLYMSIIMFTLLKLAFKGW